VNPARKHALQIFQAALAAADPEAAVLRHLKFDGRVLTAGRRRYSLAKFDRIQVIGAGKASAAMAAAVERLLGRRVSGGIVNVPAGNKIKVRRIELNESEHPIPGEKGLRGAQRIEKVACDAGVRHLLICVFSGGASALMPDPAEHLSVTALQRLTKRLLKSGATIQELNTVRKHLSRLKGGQLARLASPATVIALILSDVVGDDPAVIGSGPTAPDSSTLKDAAAVLKKYGIRVQVRNETPKPGDPAFARVQNLIVGSNRQAIDAAAKRARELGYRTLVLSKSIEGEARDVSQQQAALVRQMIKSKRRKPVCILSGGETTVTVRGKGLGGRNQEFVLSAAISLQKSGHAIIFSAGTDGIDGPTDAAGAIADEHTMDRARELGLAPQRFLNRHDSYHFFKPLGALITTGPTGTNVMDVRMFLLPCRSKSNIR
jgi:glycerate 2-kinase